MLDFIDFGLCVIISISVLLECYCGQWLVGVVCLLVNVKLLVLILCLCKNIFGIGLNYVEYVEEFSCILDIVKELFKQLVIFFKLFIIVIGQGDVIEYNQVIICQMDWEVELVVIIGKQVKGVSKNDVLDYVFGYSVMNDISVCDNCCVGQWIYFKGQDIYVFFGFMIVIVDEIFDLYNLDLSLIVNGVIK